MLAIGVTIGLATSVVAVAGITDARTGHIPNWLTLGALGVAPVLAFGFEAQAHGTHAGLVAAGLSLLGAVVCGVPPLLGFVKGAMGGGDVKLLAALGALLGPRLGLDAELYAFVLGMLYVPAKLAWHGRLFETLGGVLRALANPLRSRETRTAWPDTLKMTVRMGPAICLGTLLAIAQAWTGA